MARRRDEDDPARASAESTKSFAEAMQGDPEVAALDRSEAAGLGSKGEGPKLPDLEHAVEFVRPDPDEPLLAHAPGVQRRELRRLRAGKLLIETSIDLHGLDRAGARRALRAGLEEALRDGRQAVRVVHGKGHHSEAGPVLRAALPDWLAEAPHGPFIRAFAPAPSEAGGRGATHVWLRRRA